MRFLTHKKDRMSLLSLIEEAGSYSPENFEDLVKNFDYSQLVENAKFEIELNLWKKLDIETMYFEKLYDKMLYSKCSL
jgi:hypothetical protein